MLADCFYPPCRPPFPSRIYETELLFLGISVAMSVARKMRNKGKRLGREHGQKLRKVLNCQSESATLKQ